LTPVQVAQKVLKSASATPPPVTISPENPAEQPTSNNNVPEVTPVNTDNTSKSSEETKQPVIEQPVTEQPVKQDPVSEDSPQSTDEVDKLQQEIEKELQDVSLVPPILLSASSELISFLGIKYL